MAGPQGNYDDIIMQLLAQQQQQPSEEEGMPENPGGNWFKEGQEMPVDPSIPTTLRGRTRAGGNEDLLELLMRAKMGQSPQGPQSMADQPVQTAGYESPMEDYWAQEEAQLRKLGIDPMQVEQVVPPKLPTHPGNTTLHRGRRSGTGRA